MRFVEGPTRLYEAHYRFVVCSWYPKQVSDFSFEIETNTSDTGVGKGEKVKKTAETAETG